MSVSTVAVTMTKRDVQRQDKTRFLARMKFREQRLDFVSVQTKSTLVSQTSYVASKGKCKNNETTVGFGTRGMHA